MICHFLALELQSGLMTRHLLVSDPKTTAITAPGPLSNSYRGDVKLCDFGIAKAVVSRSHTRVGVVKG
jgi:hypothetical protein